MASNMEEEEPLTEPESPKKLRRRKPCEYKEDDNAAKKRRIDKGALLAHKKPSYCLKQGIGTGQCQVTGESLRSQHRKRLRRLLQKLMRQHNWGEASGVLSVLLQATVKDQSPSRNRAKFTAALELLHHIKGESISPKRVRDVYDLWMKKIGTLKHWLPKDRFAVKLEFIISCLQRGCMEDAKINADLYMQEYGFDGDPVSNLVVGLTYYQLWYSGIPEELQLTELDSCGTHVPSFSISKDSESGGADPRTKGDSNSSVANDQEAFNDGDSQEKELTDTDVNTSTNSDHDLQLQELDVHSAEGSGHTDGSFPIDSGDLYHACIFDTQGLPPWLLPLKLPNSHENTEEACCMHATLQNDNYKKALKHLRAALYSTPPVLEAFHPLIQMLLLGDHVGEALDEFKNLFHSSDTVLQLRLKATLLEHFLKYFAKHFESWKYFKLSTCFEDILKKDPTCSDSLTRLILFHRRGDYDAHNLAEMIALHLDATHGTRDTWKELASCFCILSQGEGDRLSTCGDGSGQHSLEYLDNTNKIPDLFTNCDSAKTWRFRCRWWRNRHFLKSDIASGDLELLTYKASVASYLYGRHFKYVVKATECLEKENNMELYSFLQMHILNSIGFYSVERNTF